jgi:hypothetical protein
MFHYKLKCWAVISFNVLLGVPFNPEDGGGIFFGTLFDFRRAVLEAIR